MLSRQTSRCLGCSPFSTSQDIEFSHSAPFLQSHVCCCDQGGHRFHQELVDVPSALARCYRPYSVGMANGCDAVKSYVAESDCVSLADWPDMLGFFLGRADIQLLAPRPEVHRSLLRIAQGSLVLALAAREKLESGSRSHVDWKSVDLKSIISEQAARFISTTETYVERK